MDDTGSVLQSIPASAEDVDPEPFAATAVKIEDEVSDAESEGVPGSGEPFPAVTATLIAAAKRQRTARGEQHSAFQKLQALKSEIEQQRAAVASRIESP